MFGRRRHVAAEVSAAPISPSTDAQLTDVQILELVHDKVAELIGEEGEWTVSRRSPDDTDTIFHSVLAQSVAVGITAAIVDARDRLAAGEISVASEPLHRAETAPIATVLVSDIVAAHASTLEAAVGTRSEDDADASDDDAVAFSWEPAPITVWTDLRKPVTGEIPTVSARPAA